MEQSMTIPQTILQPLPIDSLRLKLVQTIDQLSTLQSSLHYHSISTGGEPTNLNPGITTFPELLISFNLLLSHIVGLGGILSEVTGGDDDENNGGGGGLGNNKKNVIRDKKRDRWENEVVAPKIVVEESRDWIVGMLLRTKQTPLVESHLQSLLTSLPSSFQSKETYSNSIKNHLNLIQSSCIQIDLLKDGPKLGQEWDWKGRVDIDDDDDDESDDGDENEDVEEEVMDQGEDGEKKMKGKGKEEVLFGKIGRKWTVHEVVQFQKTGKMPS